MGWKFEKLHSLQPLHLPNPDKEGFSFFFSCCIMMFFDRTLLADLADFLFESVSSMADILRDGEVTY